MALIAMSLALQGGQESARPEIHYTGKLWKLDGRSITIKLDDGRALRMDRTGKTKLYKGNSQAKASEFGPGDQVSADATQDEFGFLFALRLTLERSATPEERQQTIAEANERPAARPASAQGRAGDGRPTLKRKDGTTAGETSDGETSSPQKPAYGADPPPVLRRSPAPAAPTASAAPAAPTASDAPAPPPVSRPVPKRPENPSENPLMARTREATFAFADQLPNFICEENMARFSRYTNAQGWQSLDVVSAEIIYENGQESYRNLKINGSPTTKKMEQLSGSWSTGEFATTITGLLHPDTEARFRDGGDTDINGVRARVFDFDVQQENSHWMVQSGDQSLTAAYKGSLWVDPESARVLRVEIQAQDLPPDFPLDVVESAVDYSAVRIAGQPVLMPVRAESLGCQRGSHSCSRNIIDFRNYRKYSSDSKIIFGEEDER